MRHFSFVAVVFVMLGPFSIITSFAEIGHIILIVGVLFYLCDYVILCFADVIFLLCWLLLMICGLNLFNKISRKKN